MPIKYQINTKPAPLGLDYMAKFKIIRKGNCINCGKCTRVCIYEAHKRRQDDPRQMADPNMIVCRNCLRCIQECPMGALEISINDSFANTGDQYWTPDILLSLWKQAETGRVPVSGAGYQGPFTGEGFDSMWTDMSEIVRPTRDGINGREYISTGVNLGRKLDYLSFSSDGQLISEIPDTFNIPLPILFDFPDENLEARIQAALVKAAVEIDTCIILPAHSIPEDLKQYSRHIIPYLTSREIEEHRELLRNARMIAIRYEDIMQNDFKSLKQTLHKLTQAVTIIRIPAQNGIENIITSLTRNGAEVIQIAADYCGREAVDKSGSANKIFLKDMLRNIHNRLVKEHIRDEITLIASGGIALPEHTIKSILCGANLTGIDIPLMVALGAKMHKNQGKSLIFPEGLDRIPPSVLQQRIVNLMGAWHGQILEVMGAMGIREISRLRGESGRAIFFEDIERDTFGKLFKMPNTGLKL